MPPVVLNGLLIAAWIVALAWVVRVASALRQFPRLPNLLSAAYDAGNQTLPAVSVIVPARNEAQAIEQTLRSLLAQTGITIEILAVDDRSTDGTGEIMDRVAKEAQAVGGRIRVIHIDSLPEGWIGKTHAMALAARQAASPWLLFTDGDVFFREDCLRRALLYAEKETDHLVLFPTVILKTFGESMILSAIQILGLLSLRTEKIANAKTRNSVCLGAFNLVRAETYRAIGGFEALGMEVLEDLRFGHEIKRHGFRQRLVWGRNLARVHWAPGVFGVVRNATKNLFAIFRFRSLSLLLACILLAASSIGPFAALAGPWPMRLAGIVAIFAIWLIYRYCGRHINGIPSAFVLLLPVVTCLLIYSLLRSMVVNLAQGGVVWRGTFYPLKELRKQARPLN